MSQGGQRKVREPNGVYAAWIVIFPAEDVPGTWVAHALEFDVVTQGSNAEDAYAMATEAVTMVLTEDLREGRDPYARRAPDECWKPLREMFDHGERLDAPKFLERLKESAGFSAFAVNVWFRLAGVAPESSRSRKSFDAPLAFGSHDGSPAHAC
jgi:predicted RNase H-like HicB family nuclease